MDRVTAEAYRGTAPSEAARVSPAANDVLIARSRPGWVAPVVGIGSIVFGYVAGTAFAVALHVTGINVPLWMAGTLSQYRTYSAVEVLVWMVLFSWALYQVIWRRLLGRQPDKRPFMERVPSFVRHPSPVGLVVIWVVAVATVIGYPVAIFMTWRFYVERRDDSKVCPQCAEKIKAAALVCRHCGHALGAGTLTAA
jgi:hypothetical protein